MIELLLSVGPAVYLLAGIAYARSQSVKIYRRNALFRQPDYFIMTMEFGSRILIWPLFVLWWYVGVPVGRWFIAPALENEARIKQLRADAKDWRSKARVGTDIEREMAQQLADLCTEQADELERP